MRAPSWSSRACLGDTRVVVKILTYARIATGVLLVLAGVAVTCLALGEVIDPGSEDTSASVLSHAVPLLAVGVAFIAIGVLTVRR